MDHDHSYKLLFSHPAMVEDLLRGFVPQPWVAEVDFTTLERVGGGYVADDLREREDDIVWRVRLGEDWLYVYLLLEFQSSIDPFMAVRMLVYLGLLYQDLIRAGTLAAGKRLPPVLPVVLYNGKPRWNAAEDIAELIADAPGGLALHRPSLRYLLLDEGRYADSDLAPLRNLAAALFRLENSRTPQDVAQVLAALVDWLQTPEQASLGRAFTVWLKRVLLPGRMPGVEFNHLNELQEVKSMLAERVIEWTEEWLRQGLEQGLEKGLGQGLARGRQEGEAAMLLRLLERRFGAVDEPSRQRLQTADAATLLRWGERLFQADSVDEVLRD
ncbi:MAG: Rpn family recombination-promoting nuclease/putative transposase [Candidatus Methylumidiphilus sp.]